MSKAASPSLLQAAFAAGAVGYLLQADPDDQDAAGFQILTPEGSPAPIVPAQQRGQAGTDAAEPSMRLVRAEPPQPG